jgi:transcriptional regulator with PAS, ATPase and Fis domain
MCDSDTLEADDFILSSAGKQKEEIELETYDLDTIEKNVIKKVLKQNQGNITKAASQLGLTRTSLYRRMEKYDL